MCPVGHPVAVEGEGLSEIWKAHYMEEVLLLSPAALEIWHFCLLECPQGENPGKGISEH